MTALLLPPASLFPDAWFLLPLAQLFRLSLGGREGPLQAYREVLGSVVYQCVFLNTVLVALVVTVVCLFLAYPTAFVLARLRGGLRAVAFYCVLVPFWISLLVRTYAWMLLLGTQGPVNAADARRVHGLGGERRREPARRRAGGPHAGRARPRVRQRGR